MLATRIAEEHGLRLVTVPLPRSVEGLMLACPVSPTVNILVADWLGPCGRRRAVLRAIEAAEGGARARLLTAEPAPRGEWVELL